MPLLLARGGDMVGDYLDAPLVILATHMAFSVEHFNSGHRILSVND